MDVGQLLVFGIDIDDLYLINDPVSTGKHSGAMIRLGYFTHKKGIGLTGEKGKEGLFRLHGKENQRAVIVCLPCYSHRKQ